MLPVLDVMQTMPSFVYLIPVVMLFNLGKIAAIIATIIYAVPPVIRLTDLGIRLVDSEVLEASRAFGANRAKQLFGVQLPLAMPNIMAGVNQTTMMALAMRSEEHTSELQSLMRISYAVFCLTNTYLLIHI